MFHTIRTIREAADLECGDLSPISPAAEPLFSLSGSETLRRLAKQKRLSAIRVESGRARLLPSRVGNESHSFFAARQEPRPPVKLASNRNSCLLINSSLVDSQDMERISALLAARKIKHEYLSEQEAVARIKASNRKTLIVDYICFDPLRNEKPLSEEFTFDDDRVSVIRCSSVDICNLSKAQLIYPAKFSSATLAQDSAIKPEGCCAIF